MSMLRVLAIAFAIASAIMALGVPPERSRAAVRDRVVIIDESMSCDGWIARDALRAEAEAVGVPILTIGREQPFESPVVAVLEGVLSEGGGDVLVVTDGIDTTGRSLGELAQVTSSYRIHTLRPRDAEPGAAPIALTAVPVTPVIGTRDPLEVEAVLQNHGPQPALVRLRATRLDSSGQASAARRAILPAGGIARVGLLIPSSTQADGHDAVVEVRAEVRGHIARDVARFTVLPAGRVLVLGGRLTPDHAASARAIAELPGLMTETLWRVGQTTRTVRSLPEGVAPLTGGDPREVASRFAACVVLDAESVLRDRALSVWLNAVVVAGVPVIDGDEVGTRGTALTPEARLLRRETWANALRDHAAREDRQSVFFTPAVALPGAPVLVRSTTGDAIISVLESDGGVTELDRVGATHRGAQWIPPGPGTYLARAADQPGTAGSVLLVRETRDEMLDRIPRTTQLARLAGESGGSVMGFDESRAWIRAGRPTNSPSDSVGQSASPHRWLAAGALLFAFGSWLMGLRREWPR
ncbi:MAG: hypothetical protein AAGG07_10815 [Planctomycetota bacterium]